MSGTVMLSEIRHSQDTGAEPAQHSLYGIGAVLAIVNFPRREIQQGLYCLEKRGNVIAVLVALAGSVQDRSHGRFHQVFG